MVDPACAAQLNAYRLLSHGPELDAWRILDTQFGAGLDFLTTWQAWRCDVARPRLLHYVALTDDPVSKGALLAHSANSTEIGAMADELARQWFGLLPGFHRFSLNDGHVMLTLCVGDLTPMLRQQQFLANAVYLKAGPDGSPWDLWAAKALTRCCQRGTRLLGFDLSCSLHAHLVQCGFEFERGQDQGVAVDLAGGQRPTPVALGQFNPRWPLNHSRSSGGSPAQLPEKLRSPGTCAVIGAGLAGASVAAALAQRGWQVQVLDAGATPAAGASGLPVGLVVPHVSADDCTLSRLSRSGVRLTLQQAQRLLSKGQDWDATGTLERRLDGAAGLAPDLSTMAGHAWSQPAGRTPCVAAWLRTAGAREVDIEEAIWHAQAAWLKPALLIQAWLALPGISFQGHAAVAGLRRENETWALLNAAGQVLARAERVVIANAMGASPLMASLHAALPESSVLMRPLPALQGVRGQVSWGLHAKLVDAAFAPFPVNGSGSVIPHVPGVDGPAWFVGANYQPESQTPSSQADNHAANLERVSNLLPHLGATLARHFSVSAVSSWQNTRCVTTDRMPLVGPVMTPSADEAQASVWLCAGMGSRGLTFSVLCAELLAAQWAGEPLPVEASLAAALDARRHTNLRRKK